MKFRSPLDWFRFQVCLRIWLICFASALFAFAVIPRLSLLVAQDGYYEDPGGYDYYDPNYSSEDGQTDDYGDPYADEDHYDDGTAYDPANDSGYPDDTTYDYSDSAGSEGNSESATGSLTGDPNLDFSDGNWPDRLSWNFNSMGPYPYGYLDADTDMDSLNDIFELNYGNWVEEVTGQYEAPDGTVYESTDWVWRGMNPNSPDSESDGLGDFEELFVLSPMMEALGAGVGFDPTDPRDSQRDLDGDFVPDHVELLDTGSDIFRKDTDGDEYDDFEEWMLGSDPNDPEDPPAGTDHPEKPDPPLPPPPPGDDPGPDPEPEPPLQPGGDGDDPGPDTPPTDPPTDPPNPDPPGDSNGGGGRPPTEEEEGDLSKQIFVEMRTVSLAYGDTGGDSGDGNGEWIPIYGPDPDDPSMEIVVGYRWEGATEDSEQGGKTEYFSAISQFENGELQSDREDNLNSASSARSNVEAAEMSQSVDWKREDTYRTFEEESGDGGTDSPHVSGAVAASFKAKKTPNDEGKDLEEGSGFLSELRLVRKTEADNRDYVKVTRPVTKRFLVVFESEPVDTPLGTDTVIEEVKAIELTIEEDEAVSVRDNQDPVSENVIEVPIVVGKRMTARLLPVDLNMDIDNDGEIGGSDSSLAQKAFEQGATEEDKEKGTEYLFVNDDLSNGIWDKDDPDAPGTEKEDDDAQEIVIDPGIDEGEVWLEHPAIDALSFYESRECDPSEKVNLTASSKFTISDQNPFPETIFVRVDGSANFPNDNPQIEGDLVLKLKVGTEEVEGPKIKLTIVKAFGAEKYFHAARDYILENNTKLLVDDREFPLDNPTSTIRICAMREEATTMVPFESYHDDAYKNYLALGPAPGVIFEPDRFTTHGLGIDGAIHADTEMTVVINGNQCDFTDPSLPDPRTEWGRIQRLANLTALALLGEAHLTDKCHGRLIINGTLNASSSDHDDPSTLLAGTSFRGSYLAGDDPIAGTTNPGGKYIMQGGSGDFEMGAGHVSLSARNAIGGLSGNYSSSDRDNYPNSFVGLAPMEEHGTDGEGVVFVAMGKGADGAGKVQEFYEAAKKSGIPEISGARPSNGLAVIKMAMLDSGDTSCALAHKDPAGNFKMVYKGNKHTGFPYYTNTFLRFKAEKPR